MWIRKINDVQFELTKLKEALVTVESRVSWDSTHNQISFVHSNKIGVNERGVGGLWYEYGHHGRKTYESDQLLREEDFTYFDPNLKDTYFYEVYMQLKIHFAGRFNLTRARLMKLKPVSVIGWHRDLEYRIHVPVITNNACRIVCEDSAYFLPADGSCFLMDGRCQHTAMNADRTSSRVHFLIQALPI